MPADRITVPTTLIVRISLEGETVPGGITGFFSLWMGFTFIQQLLRQLMTPRGTDGTPTTRAVFWTGNIPASSAVHVVHPLPPYPQINLIPTPIKKMPKPFFNWPGSIRCARRTPMGVVARVPRMMPKKAVGTT